MQDHQREISLTKEQSDRLRSLQVSLVYLFGSVAERASHFFSDIDIGIVFLSEAVLRRDTRRIYNELYDIFTDVFPETQLDIVFLQNAGLEVCLDAISHGKILFCESTDARFEFEDRVTILYADFKPILNLFDDAVLGRI